LKLRTTYNSLLALGTSRAIVLLDLVELAVWGVRVVQFYISGALLIESMDLQSTALLAMSEGSRCRYR